MDHTSAMKNDFWSLWSVTWLIWETILAESSATLSRSPSLRGDHGNLVGGDAEPLDINSSTPLPHNNHLRGPAENRRRMNRVAGSYPMCRLRRQNTSPGPPTANAVIPAEKRGPRALQDPELPLERVGLPDAGAQGPLRLVDIDERVGQARHGVRGRRGHAD